MKKTKKVDLKVDSVGNSDHLIYQIDGNVGNKKISESLCNEHVCWTRRKKIAASDPLLTDNKNSQ